MDRVGDKWGLAGEKVWLDGALLHALVLAL